MFPFPSHIKGIFLFLTLTSSASQTPSTPPPPSSARISSRRPTNNRSPHNKMSTEATTLPPPRVFHPDVMVTLLVGPDEQRMAVHSEFLTQDSRFFQAALKEEWLNGEGQSREIRLPDDIISCTSRARGVSSVFISRNMSPVETCGIPRRS